MFFWNGGAASAVKAKNVIVRYILAMSNVDFEKEFIQYSLDKDEDFRKYI